MIQVVIVQRQRRAAAAAEADDTETGNDAGLRPRSRRHVLNRVWSRPPREKPLRGPYDSPHSSDDDDVNNDRLDRGQQMDDLDANMSAEDDEELNGDDPDGLETCLCF